MRLLAIDFGTSNTVAALAVDGQAARTVTFDASPLLPSAVYVGADGQVTTGREAQRQARLDPTRFEPNPKRRIDDGEILLGDRVVPVVDVIAAVLRTVSTEVRRQLGGATPDEVRLTHPAQWGASRQNTLVSAARKAGLGHNLVLLPEPVAAAAQFTRLPGRALPPGGTVAVYDLGGGTFDVAVVGRTTGSDTAGEFHVLAEAGIPDLGGLDFDQAVLDHVGRVTSSVDPRRWQQILRPVDSSTRRAARALAEDVRAAKETLSRYPHTEVALPDPFVDAHLTRSEFEGLIRTNLLRSIEVLATTLRNAGVEPGLVTGIFLVGGSSRIPLVAALIQDRLHVTPVALDQPETAVALGALLVPLRRDGNRTVAMLDGPRRPPSHPAAGQVAPAPGGGPTGGSEVPVGPSRAGAPTGRPPSDPDSGPVVPVGAGRSRRRGLVVGAAGVVVVLIVGAVLLITRPFGGVADPTTTGSTTPGTSAASSSGSAAGGSSSNPSATTGLGPGQAFTAGEMAFMGSSVTKLINCSDQTKNLNPAISVVSLRAERIIRCDIPSDFADPISGRALMWVMTVKPGQAGKYLDDIVLNRKTLPDDLSSDNTDAPFTASSGSPSGRVVTGAHVPAFGKTDYAKNGDSVLAWTFNGQDYVGLVNILSYEGSSSMLQFFREKFQPR